MKYNKMNKTQLTALALDREMFVAEDAKKADIIAMLEADDTNEAAKNVTTEAAEKKTAEKKAPKLTVAEMLLDRLAVGGLSTEFEYSINAKGHVLLKLPNVRETVARIRGTKNGAYVFPGKTLKKAWEEAGYEMEYHKGWANEYCIFCATPERLFTVLLECW